MSAGAVMEERTEASISSAALHQTMTEDRHDMLWALAQAEALLDQLAELGRYPRNPARQERESDLLRLALALMRARRQGVEDAATLHAWWRDPVYGTRAARKASMEASADPARSDGDGRARTML